ncbi:MAG TPA: hypothetical protein VI758_05310 [Bacteroidota bacterium]
MNTGNPRLKLNDRTILVSLLVILGIVLTLTVVPGVFIIDEDNYLATVVALRHGMLKAPGTEHLTPSRELVWFDPEANHRVVESTPVVALVAPLYAFVALPFSYLGLRGLFFLNTLAFLVSVYLVFCYVERVARERMTPWVASILFALGGYCVEYAQGLWPQMLSVALCLGSLFLCFQARKKETMMPAFVGGILAGAAIGVREPNVAFAFFLGVGLLLFARKRVQTAASYASGIVLVLFVIATINFYRYDVWHPFPKVVSYAEVVAANTAGSSIVEPLRVFWSKVVDYSSYGQNTDHIRSGHYQWNAASGTILMNGIMKKSWIQSSPWLGLALIGMVAAWFARRATLSMADLEIRTLGLIVVPTLLVFVAAGFNRTDGLSFNQRYFLELLPLTAIVLGLFIDRVTFKVLPAGIGFVAGMALVAAVLSLAPPTAKLVLQRFLPVVLSAATIVAWYASRNRSVFLVFIGLCVGWALFFHLETDLVGSRFRREVNSARYDAVEKVIPDHAALFAYWGNKDAAGPLQLAKDVVILDVWADGGQDAIQLEGELLARKRRVYVLANDMPQQIYSKLLENRDVRVVSEGVLRLVEVSQR